MASWNGQYIGNANWQGAPQFASQTQLISSTQGVASQPQLTSTSLGLYNYTTGASNVLQGEINAIVAGGTTALWANYRAINNVDLSGHDLINSRYLSTQDLQVSSINGADIKLFGSTVVVGGVTIVNNTVKAAQVEKTTSVTDTINNIAGAVGSVVDVVQKAASGALADTGAVLQQVYWGTAAVDQVVDLTNGVVTLATGIQGLIDSRQNNSISGGGVSGQTTNVYETINGTTQFQFSTLGSAVTTVFRTTDQQFPNLKIGREVFISTILPAGSKVIRSVSDPLSMPILSTQLLSTTNFLQSFGQWHSILEPDYNLNISTLKVDSLYGFASLSTGKISTTVLEAVNMDVSNLLNTSNLYVAQNATVIGSLTSGSFVTGTFSATNSIVTSLSTNTLSTGSAIISSLNGLAFNSIIKGNDSSFNSLSTNQLSAAIVYLSSINGYPFTSIVNTGDQVLNSISTNTISTGFINGYSISSILNTGDRSFNSLAVNKISTARISISSINDTIYFGNQPIGNDIRGVNGFYAATGTFNTSLTTNGTLAAGAANLGTLGTLGITATGNVSATGSLTANSLSITTSITANTANITGTITGGNVTTAGVVQTSGLSVSNNATVGGTLTAGNINTTGTVNANNVTAALNLTANAATITTATITTDNITTANITTANITNTNTGVINAGAGSLALTYGSITFNGSPYAPTSPGGADITVNSVSTIVLSTGLAYISSINGINITSIVNPVVPGSAVPYLSSYTVSTGSVAASSIQSYTISTGTLSVSSIQTQGGLYNTLVSTTTSYSGVSSVQQNVLNYQMVLTSLPEIFDMGGFFEITAANEGLWSHKQIDYSGVITSGSPILNITVDSYVNGDYFDFKNVATNGNVVQVWNPYGSGGLLLQVIPGGFYRFTYSAGVWSYAANPTQVSQTATNLFSLTQGWDTTTLSTNNILNLNAGEVSLQGFTSMNLANIVSLTNSATILSSLTAQTISTGTLNGLPVNNYLAVPPFVSSFSLSTGTLNGIPLSNYLSANPYISTLSLSTGQIYTSSIQMIGGFIVSTNLALLSSAQYDFSKSITLVSTAFSTLSSFQNNILSYSYTAIVGDETSFNIGVGYTVTGNNVSQWASTILIGNSTQVQPISLEIDNDPGSGWTGTGTFDVKRTLNNGQPPYDIYVAYTLGVSPLIIDINDYNLYRFTKTTTGVGGWSYTVNPPTYQTSNNNTFQIYQNLTDVTIATTDNLNLIAGSIKLQGNLQLSNVNILKGNFQNLTASNIIASTLTATNTQFQSLSTIYESVTNLYAGYINTSSINISTQQSTPMILGIYNNVYNVTSYTSPPPQQLITSETDMTITSANPAYTYTGTGSQTITFDAGNRVYLNGTLQSSSWNFATLKVNSAGLTVNVSTIAGNSSNGNYYINEQIANFNVKGGLVFALYTSGTGFLGNVSGNLSLLWNGADFTTASYVPFTGLTYASHQQTVQTVSSLSLNTNVQYIISSPVLNVNTNPSSNVPTVNFGGRTVEVFTQRVDGYIAAGGGGAWGKGDAAATVVSPTGKTFPVSQYNCVVSQAGLNVYGQYSLALNEQVWQTYQDTNGNWAFHFYCTTATVGGSSPNFYAIAGITMIPYDLGHFSGFQNPDHLGEGNGGPPLFVAIQLSTIYTSTVTMLALENISLNAATGIPTFLGNGNIALNANSNIDLMANYDIIAGAGHDITLNAGNNINLNPNNLNTTVTNSLVTLASTINSIADNIKMTAINPVIISPALSTVALLGVSTINGNRLPWLSTYNTPTAYYTATGSASGTPQIITGQTVTVPYPGDYVIRRKIIFTKKTGNNNNNPYPCLFLNTNSNVPGVSTGVAIAALPFTQANGISSFATLQSIFTVTSPLTRNVYYYDQGEQSYTASLCLGPPSIEYIPPPLFLAAPVVVFDPTSLAAPLITWFDGNVGLTTSSWTNRGTDGGAAPLYYVSIGSQNGLPCAYFPDQYSYGYITQNFTGDSRAVFAVYAMTSQTVGISSYLLAQYNSGFFWSAATYIPGTGQAQYLQVNNGYTLIEIDDAVTYDTTQMTTVAMAYDATGSNTNSFITYNGNPTVLTYYADAGLNASATSYINGGGISGSGAAVGGCGMTLCELLSYDGIVSPSDGSNVVNYLRTKWGTP